jgi:hypothetical protein
MRARADDDVAPRRKVRIMEDGAIAREPMGKVVPLRVAAQPPPPLEELVEQGVRIAIGLSALATEVLAEAVARTLGREPFADGEAHADEAPHPATGIPLVAGAAIGLGVEVARWSARAATTAFRSAELFVSLATSPAPVRTSLERVSSRFGSLDARWREQRPRDEEAAGAFLRLLIPQIVDATLDQIDLNELVAERVEPERIVERLDLDGVIARIDLDTVARRIDIDRIVERIDLRAIVDRVPVEDVVSRLDLDAIVARVDIDGVVRRVDVQAVADRIDLQALVERLDLTTIANEVIEEIDLTGIIQEAMGSMTTETVGGIRVQSMNADRAIARLVGRVLGRAADDPTGFAPGDDREPD